MFVGNGSQLTELMASTLWSNTNTNDVYLPNNGNVGIGTTITNAGAALSIMNGNVGIGTWVPAQNLQVNGNIKTTGTIYFNTYNGYTPSLFESGYALNLTNGVGTVQFLTGNQTISAPGPWLINPDFAIGVDEEC